MVDIAGCASLARLLKVPHSTMQNWVNRGDFPYPVIDNPRRWSIDAVRHWVASRPIDHRAKKVEKGGLALADWDEQPVTIWMLYKRLNLPDETSARQLVARKGFPDQLPRTTADPVRRWDRESVALWLAAHRGVKVLRHWIEGTWEERIFILEPGMTDLLGVAQILGITERSAQWYAFNEPTFPDEGPLGQWVEEDVLFWLQFEAPEDTRSKIESQKDPS